MGIQWTVKNLTGQVFGRLTVLRRNPVNHSHGNARWDVRCECGVEKTVRSCHLLNGHTVSCGCYGGRTIKPANRDVFLFHMLTRYRKGAAKRGIFFNLTASQLDELMQRNCFYCGVPPQQINKTFRGNIGAFPYNGVDRLANHLGYFFENCVACCGTCNVAKQDMSVHAFVTWAQRLAWSLNAAV
jgi:hypothetical protein